MGQKPPKILLLILGDKASVTLGLYEGQPLVPKGKKKYLFAPSSVHGYQQAIWVARRTYELSSPLAITLGDGCVFLREGFLVVIVIFWRTVKRGFGVFGYHHWWIKSLLPTEKGTTKQTYVGLYIKKKTNLLEFWRGYSIALQITTQLAIICYSSLANRI